MGGNNEAILIRNPKWREKREEILKREREYQQGKYRYKTRIHGIQIGRLSNYPTRKGEEKMKEKRCLSLWATKELYEKVDEAAEKNGIKKGELLREYLTENIKQIENYKPKENPKIKQLEEQIREIQEIIEKLKGNKTKSKKGIKYKGWKQYQWAKHLYDLPKYQRGLDEIIAILKYNGTEKTARQIYDIITDENKYYGKKNEIYRKLVYLTLNNEHVKRIRTEKRNPIFKWEE